MRDPHKKTDPRNPWPFRGQMYINFGNVSIKYKPMRIIILMFALMT